MVNSWTEEQDEYLRKHYRSRGVRHCALKMGRSQQAIMARAKRIGVAREIKVYYGRTTLCWDCARPGTLEPCSWDINFTPVEGWEVDIDKDGGCCVIRCPMFKEDRE